MSTPNQTGYHGFFLDSTFRDGVQQEDAEITSTDDALESIKALDQLGLTWLELGFASSSQLARDRIKAALKLDLKTKIAAFGRTHTHDVNLLLELKVPTAVLVAKSRLRDVTVSLGKTGDDNLQLITDCISQLVSRGVEVILDAEHFFQAFWEDDRDYALKVLTVALKAGANWLVLCDTNGKMNQQKFIEAINAVSQVIPIDKLGVHCHNDRGLAVANSQAAWQLGVRHIQGTCGGFGERVGNTDLFTIISNLYLEGELTNITPDNLLRFTESYILICDTFNIAPEKNRPYVGDSAFYTEAGMHQSGLERDSESYLHTDPKLFGNRRRTGLSDQSGKANLKTKAQELGLDIPSDILAIIAQKYQTLVDAGADFGMADASFFLFIKQELNELPKLFSFSRWQIYHEKKEGQPAQCEASLKITTSEGEHLFNADGDGPVNALDQALRKALTHIYPALSTVRLIDYKVNIVDSSRGSAAKVRVLIRFTDGQKTWTTMGVEEDINEASWEAIKNAYVYKIVINGQSSH